MLQYVSLNALNPRFEADQVLQIELALEEAIVNIIKHGYKESSGIIEIHWAYVDNGVRLKLIDSGIPFNPLQNVTIPEVGSIGGYGISMITKIMDSSYEHTDGFNILTLSKNLSKI